MAVDPKIDYSSGTITLDFESDTNYTFSKMTVKAFDGGNQLMLVPQNYQANKYDTFEDSDFTNWKILDNLTQGTSNNPFESGQGEESNGADADVNSLGGAFGLVKGKRILIVWFYDNNTTTLGNAWSLNVSLNNKKPPNFLFRLGFDTDHAIHSTKYLYDDSSGFQNTGITRSEGWHHLVIFSDETSTIDDITSVKKMYLDGTTIFDVTQTNPVESGAPFATQWKAFMTQDDDWRASQTHIIDEIVLSKANNVFEEGTAQIDIQPDLVKEFTSVTFDDDTANGAWQGTIKYEFQHSSNGGASFGALQTLNNSNLQGLTLAGNGQDVLRIKITHTPDIVRVSNTFIPRTNQIVINFKGYRYPFEYFK